MVVFAAEGRTYYVDPVTKAASWEKPDSLYWRETADAEVSSMAAFFRCWPLQYWGWQP